MNWLMIALIEAGVIIILLLLIIFRKIGHPLSDLEVRQRIKRREQKDARKRERQRQRQLEREQKLEKISTQEREIRNMPRPVTFVSLSGDDLHGRTLCVQDGNGTPHTLYCHDYDLDKAPFFHGLYESSIEPNYYSKRGAVLLK